jgi:hypothetical protein
VPGRLGCLVEGGLQHLQLFGLDRRPWTASFTFKPMCISLYLKNNYIVRASRDLPLSLPPLQGSQ